MKLKLLKNFRDDESGGILAFTLIMFLMMVLGGGMAVDFMNYEYRREGVQDALDRGVLAATGLGKDAGAQTDAEIAAAEADAILTVFAYVRSAGYNPDELGLTVSPNFTINSQLVAAASNFDVDTYFLRIAGIDTLNGGAASSARVVQNDIELSLIVDISGSMRGTKIVQLRTAATNFVTSMLEGDRPDYTTISLVPFSGQVAAKNNLMSHFQLSRWHTYSNCVNFSANDYNSTAISRTAPLQQSQHFSFQWIRNRNSNWCPNTDISIVPFSNSAATLTSAITNLRATGQTAAYLGMKWGVALLDPDAQAVFDGLAATPGSGVDSSFQDRPAQYSDTDTLKFAILMTDGANTDQYAIRENKYRVFSVIIDPNRDPTEYPNYTAPEEVIRENDYDGDGRSDWSKNEGYILLDNDNNRVAAPGQLAADYWEFNTPDYNNNYRISRVNGTWGANNGDDRLQDICDAAKQARIVVFTIGYDVAENSNPYTQMRNCATTPGYFYHVDSTGGGLDAAFDSIRQSIQKLKLVN